VPLQSLVVLLSIVRVYVVLKLAKRVILNPKDATILRNQRMLKRSISPSFLIVHPCALSTLFLYNCKSVLGPEPEVANRLNASFAVSRFRVSGRTTIRSNRLINATRYATTHNRLFLWNLHVLPKWDENGTRQRVGHYEPIGWPSLLVSGANDHRSGHITSPGRSKNTSVPSFIAFPNPTNISEEMYHIILYLGDCNVVSGYVLLDKIWERHNRSFASTKHWRL